MLPPVAFGRQFAYHGHLGTIVGTFRGDRDPRGDTGILRNDYPYRTAGPLTHARLVSVDETSCNFGVEGYPPQAKKP